MGIEVKVRVELSTVAPEFPGPNPEALCVLLLCYLYDASWNFSMVQVRLQISTAGIIECIGPQAGEMSPGVGTARVSKMLSRISSP